MAKELLPGGVGYGLVESMKITSKDISARWLKASRAMKKEEQVYGQRLAKMAPP